MRIRALKWQFWLRFCKLQHTVAPAGGLSKEIAMEVIRSRDIPGQNNESTFVVVHASPGRFYLSRTVEGKVLYNRNGEISLNVERRGDIDIASGKMVFIPPSCSFSVYVKGITSFYLYRLSLSLHFNESSLPLETLEENLAKQDTPLDSPHINAHDKVDAFFHILGEYIRDGISAHMFYTYKARELLILLHSYYPIRELARFFSPIIGRNTEFAAFVTENYRKYRTARELAEASCHSLSSFNRLFRQNFGCSPYAWMDRQKANDVYYELTATNLPIKQISSEHGFGSLSQFTAFCKRHYGLSPRTLRNRHGFHKEADPRI